MGARKVEGKRLTNLADQIIAGVLPLVEDVCAVAATGSQTAVERITTESPMAYRHYAAGLLAKERGLSTQAVEEFQRAVEIDSTFALAHVALSKAHDWNIEIEQVQYHAERAWELRAKLGVRDRLRLEAWRADAENRRNECMATYREILARWPDDRETLTDLSRHLWFHWCWREALPVVEQALDLYPDDLELLGVHQHSLANLQRDGEALPSAHKRLRHDPRNPNFWDDLGHRYLELARPDSAGVAFTKALEINPSFLPSRKGLGWVAYARGDLGGAIAHFEELLADPNIAPVKRTGIVWTSSWPGLSELYIEAGRHNDALDLIERSRESARGLGKIMHVWKLYQLGRFDDVLRRGRLPGAKRIALGVKIP